MSGLEFTGERFIPGTRGEIWVEHWHRYHFAARWVAGRRVLDVACGEGYGSALLARHAAQVTGVDVSPEAVAHATRAYAALPNARFVCASCTALPLPDASVDVAVSFETIEHIAGQERFLDELHRVLAPGGLLVLSCPNKLEYSDKRHYRNEFHVKELYREELRALLAARFPALAWYGQRPTFYSVIAPEDGAAAAASHLVEVTEAQPSEAAGTLASPMYFLVVAGRSWDALREVPPALSVLSDRDDWVHSDYEKVMRMLHNADAHIRALDQQVAQRDRALAGAEEEAKGLRTAIGLQEVALRSQEALLRARDEAHAAELEARDREILRRRGWRWWLRLPLVRLGLLKA